MKSLTLPRPFGLVNQLNYTIHGIIILETDTDRQMLLMLQHNGQLLSQHFEIVDEDRGWKDKEESESFEAASESE